jgi:aldehyde dehydrogenase (NAD+)
MVFSLKENFRYNFLNMEYSAILDGQRKYFNEGGTRNPKSRKAALKKLMNILKSSEARLNEAIMADFGKSEFDAYTSELSMIYSEIRFQLRHLKGFSRARRARTNVANKPGRYYVVPEPLGCSLIIGAWNYPYQLTLVPLIDAIAAGCTCILKPSEMAPATSKLLAELLNGNFPNEYVYVAEGGADVASALLALKFDKIFFTGSTRVGKIVYEAAAKNMTPVTLELGGKSPVFVTADANLEIAAKRIVWGKFLNAGQTCVAPDYVYVEEDVLPQFISLLKAQISFNKYGDGSNNYTRIINERHFDRILGLIDPSKVVFGGGSNRSTLFIEPTIMSGVTWDDAVMQEEIFGPVLPLLTFKDLDDAIETVRSKERPLAAYVFSSRKSEQKAVIEGLSFGGGCVNDVVMHMVNENVPFGGVGASGIGSYHGRAGFDCFTHHKTILRKGYFETSLKYPPYSANHFRAIRRILK